MIKKILLILSLGVVLGAIFYGFYQTQNSDRQLAEQLDQAMAAYQKAEKGTTPAERQQGFKTAIKIYTEMEEKYRPCFSSGRFYYNLANAYFQAEEYPLAVLYYYRALYLRPGNSDIQHNLDAAMKKLNLQPNESPSAIQRLFFFHYGLSLTERLQLFFYFGVAVLAIISIMLWLPATTSVLKYVMALAAFVCLVFFTSLLYSRYIDPVEGVLMRSTFLYRDKGKQYATVSTTPSPAGAKAIILDVQDNGAWLKITLSDGSLGYVPADAIRLIPCE